VGLEFVAVRVKPGAIVVALQLTEEGERLGREGGRRTHE
jgi:hypothetical protein